MTRLCVGSSLLVDQLIVIKVPFIKTSENKRDSAIEYCRPIELGNIGGAG